jgi:5-hydroxyisourate hydrolase
VISLSTHVLDTERGLPAQGVPVSLFRGRRRLAGGQTDADGRIARLAQGLAPGGYHLLFDLLTYFAAQGRPRPFLRRLDLELSLDEDRHYHVPLLLAPYACTTYRGS